MRMLLVGLCFMLAGPASRAGDKLNPYLRLLGRDVRLVRAFLPAAGKISPALVPVLVLTSDPGATAAAVRRAGVGAHTGRPVGNILPVRAPVALLARIAQRPEVERIEAVPPRRLLLDLSRPDVRADQVERGPGVGLPLPITGQGVIAALVDTGVDYEHQDFGGRRGRVLQIWDQFAASGDPPEGQNTGALCDRSRIIKGTCDSIDAIGHGTHVSATMASSSDTYRGMAPGANIMAVASIDFGLLIESVAWLFAESEKLNRPMVINLSLGGHYGPHDGSSLESRALSDLTGPGKIIVAAAGNEGSDLIHLGYDPAGVMGKTLFEVFNGLDAGSALFTIWQAADSDLRFSIGVQKNGTEVAQSDAIGSLGAGRSFVLTDSALELGTIYFEPAGAPDPGNGKLQLDIVVEPGAQTYSGNPDNYVWFIKASGTGAFDAWSAATGALTPPARFSDSDADGLVPGDNSKTIGMPAAARKIIAVASYATRSHWTDIDGTLIMHPETQPSQISFFSSRGPSADPEATGVKPLVAAPGEYIVAALSRHTSSLEAGTTIDTGHIAMRGTSMACPHVAGIVALLLEADPTLDPDGVTRILAATARQDEFTGGNLPNARWGYGKVDALEAVAMALHVGVCDADTDCVAGMHCSGESRCQENQAGCSCGSAPSPGEPLLLVFLALLAYAWLRGRCVISV
ncbi:MAG TPA: S8 family serine peptidase [Myxococcota bacterium]|nr:S8 family serine peptidase [Myxococcota bacterium]